MVSIVLLTTEEVLQRNGFWHCLDTIWITQELEPFEEIKPEHVYSKPLSRDIYYAKFPDIPRSESEDENSLTVKGFIDKHREWKSKICIRKLDSRRNSTQTTFSVKSDCGSNNRSAISEASKLLKPLITVENKSEKPKRNIINDERVRNFFRNLLQSIPPPPIEEFSREDCSIIQQQRIQTEISDIDLPDYGDFENDCILKSNEEQNYGPITSTLKKYNNKTNSNMNSIKTDSSDQYEWYETIYGVSDLLESRELREFTNSTHKLATTTENDDVISWSDIVEMCGLTESILGRETFESENVISQSHYIKDGISDLSGSDEEDAYTKFACNKLRQSLKNKGGIPDSSSIENLNCENDELMKSSIIQNDPTLYKTFYRLAPDEEDLPPENELQKNSDRVLSEHELRVQRSLQKLNVPEWYKNAPAPREGFLLRKRLSDASASATRWSGLNSKTTSLSSLGANAQPPPPQLSPHTTSFGRWSTSRLNSNQTSPCSSTRSSIRGTSPLCSPSARSSFSARQPYLGWRSQERLNSTPRTPHERLASSLLQQTASARASEEIQTSIKEVTSAIVHYVSGLEPANGDIDRQPSPRSSQKLYWLESSFVGTKPLESPQTPLVVSDALPPPHPRPPSSLRLDHRAAPDWQDSHRHSTLNLGITRPSPGSTTLEDVLDSLLGLPSQPTRIPTPQPSPRKSASPYFLLGGKSPRYEQLASSGHSSISPASRFIGTPSEGRSSFTDPSPDHDRAGKDTVDNPATMQESRRSKSAHGESRRRSEPFAHTSMSLDRRTSLDATAFRPEHHLTHHDSKASLASLQTENSTDEAFVKCKYPKCSSRAPLADAKRHYKTCHNCTTTYCSKECRRAHWEKHRKVCLHSRASTLCRHIISAAKEDSDSLHQISTIAHKGYLAQGRGVVKVFFTSPEAAEKFTTHGYQYLSEPEFVKWHSLQPNEMGAELYTEVVKLCKSYNPETRVILYVAVCIISEVPTKGAVKWERQMVSRCAKLRLSKSVSATIQEQNRKRNRRDSKGTPEDRETLILTSKLTNAGDKNAATAHKYREICFRNILKEFESRGVMLKKHFPEVYSRLAAYVDGTSDRFIPMTIYPRDATSGKSFVCVIMPDCEMDGTPVDGQVITVDVGVDRSKHQLSTPM
ncbi:jg12853 [Pararge aegeria aegeria]|uniref:Jg12853 protein n=1 Tax=Pararge aegeria aegeria TaxID=348720 RepID=A0A8S4S3R1_9NEOP|nr:jg12853 [Pararge aegeria aegeria]